MQHRLCKIDPLRHSNQMFWCLIWARFLSLARRKPRLCSVGHRAGYFSNLACDWLSLVRAYPAQKKPQKTGPEHVSVTIRNPFWNTYMISAQVLPVILALTPYYLLYAIWILIWMKTSHQRRWCIHIYVNIISFYHFHGSSFLNHMVDICMTCLSHYPREALQ